MEGSNHDVLSRSRTKTMKAAVQSGFGKARDVIRVEEIPIPDLEPDRVLVDVAAASLNALDYHYMTGTPRIARLDMGLRRPKRTIPGADIAGTIAAIGSDVTDWKIGDEVFGEIGSGGFAEFARPRASVLAPKPANVTMAEASTLGVAALTALQGLRDWGGLQPGQSVLINGASGGVGTFAVQIAKALGADHVTGVCSSGNVETAYALGADRVIDYTKDDFTALGDRFDIFFDNAGSKSLGRSRSIIEGHGVLVMVTGKKGGWIRPVDRVLGGVIRSRFWSQRFVSKTARADRADLLVLKDMVESGLVKPVMDRSFSLDEAADALAYQSEGHARGKSVVIP